MNDQNKAELRRLAEAAGGITWVASRATSHQGRRSSRSIYHYPTPYHCVEIVETPDSDPENSESIHDESSWAFIGAAHPAAILSLLEENEQLCAEVEALRSSLRETTAVAITMLYDSHPEDVAGEFTVAELQNVVSSSAHLATGNEQVESIYRKTWDLSVAKEGSANGSNNS